MTAAHISAAILGAVAVGLAAVSAWLAVRGKGGDGWALLAFLCLLQSCSKL